MRPFAPWFLVPSLVSVIVVLFVLSACTDDAEGADRGPDVLAATDTPLRLAMVHPGSMRPDELSLSDQPAVIVADLLYDGLVEVDAGTGSLVPALAAAWSADDHFRRWTFELDRTTGVDAEIVAASLATLVWPIQDEIEVGTRSMAALTAGMRSVTATDPATVVIELAEPNAGLPWILSGLPFSIIGPDGGPTGDYRLHADRGAEAELRRRTVPAGRVPEDLSGLGPPSTIEITWTDSASDAYRLLVDRAVDGAVVDPRSVPDARDRFGSVAQPTSAVRYYVINHHAPELADRAERSAILRAVDRERVIGRLGWTALAVVDGLVSPSAAGYHPPACGPDCRLEPIEVEPTAADGWPTAELDVSYAGADQEVMARALAEQLTHSGMPARESEVSPRDLATAIVGGSTDLFAFGWVAPAGSVDAVLPPLLRAESPANVARIATPEVDELLDRAAVTADDELRWDLLDRAHRLAMTEAKILPLAVSTSTLVLAADGSPVAVRSDGSIDVETVE